MVVSLFEHTQTTYEVENQVLLYFILNIVGQTAISSPLDKDEVEYHDTEHSLAQGVRSI